MAFRAYSLPFLVNGRWTYRFEQIKQHRERAEALAQSLRTYLHAHPAAPASIQCRRDMGPEATVPDASAAR